MIGLLVRRLLQSAVLLILVIAAVFLIFQVMPGDITTVLIDPEITPEARQAVIERLGLDRPVHERFLIYMGGVARLDLGTAFPTASFRGGRPVTEIVAERLPRTILLFVTVVLVNYGVGFAAGKRVAWRRGRMSEFVPTALGVVLHNIFTPVAGLVILWLFALKMGLFHLEAGRNFPAGSRLSNAASPPTMCLFPCSGQRCSHFSGFCCCGVPPRRPILRPCAAPLAPQECSRSPQASHGGGIDLRCIRWRSTFCTT